MFRALGDPSRLRLLARLAGGDVCVTELAELEDEKLSTISARLKTLHEVRLVKRRREAKHIYYALSDSHVLRLVQNAMKHAAEKK
jgi:DNA-binding transcriptional ArsR family regulator